MLLLLIDPPNRGSDRGAPPDGLWVGERDIGGIGRPSEPESRSVATLTSFFAVIPSPKTAGNATMAGHSEFRDWGEGRE